jgi:UTP--glucose-1-phosphate uridylyltransferase
VRRKLRKTVIPVAGLGTRMLPFTKEQPKEMLPVYANGIDNAITIEPIVQLIFGQLYNAAFREFCFIVGRGKRVIEDHFTINYTLKQLVSGKISQTNALDEFYREVESSKIFWINQGAPRGFGHAVLLSESLVGDDDEFLVHAGDVSIVSVHDNEKLLGRVKTFHSDNDFDVTLVVRKINDIATLRQHGIVTPGPLARKGFEVKQVIEKPCDPPSNFAIMPVYVFKTVIFEALKRTDIDKRGELQLTDAIQTIINDGGTVGALEMNEEEIWLDIGTPRTYMEALNLSYKYASRQSIVYAH